MKFMTQLLAVGALMCATSVHVHALILGPPAKKAIVYNDSQAEDLARMTADPRTEAKKVAAAPVVYKDRQAEDIARMTAGYPTRLESMPTESDMKNNNNDPDE